jgi:cystathionine beta-lyase
MPTDRPSKPRTRLVHAGRTPHEFGGVVNTPVFHASTVLSPSLQTWREARSAPLPNYPEGVDATVTYGVSGTSTTYRLEAALCEVYKAGDVVMTPSGLSAITAGLFAVLKAGDHLLMTDTAYFPTRKFCTQVLAKYGIETTYYDPRLGAGIAELIRPNTACVYTESPGSQTFEIQDIPAIAEAAHRAGACVMMDNTWGTPLFCDPFALGVDVVNEAVTKYIGGHSDLIMGLIASTREYAERVRSAVRLHGHHVAPDDLFLAARGLRTMELRLRQTGENGLALARWLERQPQVETVLHPALESHPDHALWKRDFTGCSGLFSAVFKPVPDHALAAFYDGLELFGLGASWGGFESLVKPTDLSLERSATDWPYDGPIVRFYTGLEDPDDLIADVHAGLERMTAVAAAA